MAKLGIIVPYRNREKQLERFIPYMVQYFEDVDITDYEIFIVEQSKGKAFNRGALLNIGFLEAERLGCDYVAFHDLDMLPVSVDYSYTDKFTQVARHFKPERKISYDYAGGVTLFPVNQFREIGGYSNEYWGWGYEDNDLLLRCVEKGVGIKKKYFKQPESSGKALAFSGESYVKFPRPVSFNRSCLIYVDFILDELKVDISQGHDEASIFSIPGLDITLAYDSFGTYKFELFDTYEDVYSIHTEKLPPMHCRVIIYYDAISREIRFFLNDNLIGVKPIQEDRKIKVQSQDMYLGLGSPERTYKKPFIGKIFQFVAVDRCTEEIFLDIVGNGIETLDREDAAVWFDANYVKNNTLLDLSEHGRDGHIVDCQIVDIKSKANLAVPVPNSRDGCFRLQKHTDNGAKNGYWKSWNTRLNQERYYNRSKTGSCRDRDGLVNIGSKFEWEIESSEKNIHIIKANSIDETGSMRAVPE